MKFEAELTGRGSIRIETEDVFGKPVVIEKTLAANELQRLGFPPWAGRPSSAIEVSDE